MTIPRRGYHRMVNNSPWERFLMDDKRVLRLPKDAPMSSEAIRDGAHDQWDAIPS